MKENYIWICALPFILYSCYLAYFFFISQRHKALQPILARNQKYRTMYYIMVFSIFYIIIKEII